jgi:hypothetical protein
MSAFFQSEWRIVAEAAVLALEGDALKEAGEAFAITLKLSHRPSSQTCPPKGT